MSDRVQEKTLAELAQGKTGFASLRILPQDQWQRGLVFGNGGTEVNPGQGERFFCSVEATDGDRRHDMLVIRHYRILNNGVKVGSEVLAIPAAELKALLSGGENG